MSLAERLRYAAYDVLGNALGLVALPLLPLLLLTRHGRGLRERLGLLPPAVRQLQRPLWVHASSVGEVLAARPLVQEFRRAHSECPILVSTTSVTGRETARAQLAVDAAMLLPIDLGWLIDRTVRQVQPRCIVVVETEIWPALIRAAARQRIPLLIVSGRISERAAARYAWIRWLLRPVLSQVAAFAMQTTADAARIIALGAPAQRVQVLGSLKFARTPSPQAPVPHTLALGNGRPLLIAASTHPGEEHMALAACAGLWAEYPQLLLLIAPRRPERFDEVDQLLARAGVMYERRSRLRGAVDARTQVLLLDTVGELPDVLPAARAVFVGGTVAPVGGHNVLEPAVFGKPVAFGPCTTNVAFAAEALLEGRGAARVADARALHVEWSRLLGDPIGADAMGHRAHAVVAAHTAVAQRTFELVDRCMESVRPRIVNGEL